MYFNVTIKVDRIQDNGQMKQVKETYCFDALTYTEAEAKAMKKLAPYVNDELFIDTIKKTRIVEVINNDSDKFYLAKLAFVTIDEKSGMEKKSISQMLVGAQSFREAYDTLTDAMKGTVSDYEIVSIAESPILEVFA